MSRDRTRKQEYNRLYRQSVSGAAMRAAVKERRRQEKVRFLNETKARRGCCFCAEREPVALDFHHRDPVQKKQTLSDLVSRDASLARLIDEVEKCVVVCANCHRKLHAGLIALS